MICVLAFIVYQPGLSGPFLLDDYINLEALGRNGGIHSLGNWWQFITSGEAGPLGRPLALVSFTLNAQDWPSDPLAFKVSNLLLHLLNGVLVSLLSFMCTEQLGYTSGRQVMLALGIGAFWLVTPIQVTSALYVVQGMTILSTTFTLIGLILYLQSISKLENDSWRSLLGPASIILMFTILASLSKENGILLPAYASLLTFLFHKNNPQRPKLKYGAIILLLAPILLMAAVFVIDDFYYTNYQYRPFNLFQRVITEPRALFSYAFDVLIPNLRTGSLYTDVFPVSTGLFSPVTTFVSLTATVFHCHYKPYEALLCFGVNKSADDDGKLPASKESAQKPGEPCGQVRVFPG